MLRVRLTHLDGKLPNLALMRLASFHRDHGDAVVFSRSPDRETFEGPYDRVYGSAIFSDSAALIERLRRSFPDAIVGGTGSGSTATVQTITAASTRPGEPVDYTDYPTFRASLGFTQRGCRMRCKFCVVPDKEGRPHSVATVAEIYRGAPYPRHLHLLDNDFFGQPEAQWRARLAEIRQGGFKVCFNQGINIRLVSDEIASELATVEYRDDGFQQRRLYTAWDNLKDEAVFMRGVDRLERAGIEPNHLMAYMLVGYDPSETWERIFHRFNRMVERGIKPFPMVYDRTRRDLKAFQRWAVRGLYRIIPWTEYRSNGGSAARRTPPRRNARLGPQP
jgi:hypothetical protein